jgi:NAD(P)-dependent dehydrogenase (short-subunit alcohol dehydrogenase family)
MKENRFTDQVVIISGGGTGIGKGCALAFAQEGAQVIIAQRREALLKETVDEIQSKGGKADYKVTDISSPDQVKSLINGTLEKFGKLDVLVANAAVPLWAPIINTTDQNVQELVDINVKGTYYQMREAVRVMCNQGYGNIVVVSSGSGSIGHPNMSLYCGTKAAVSNMVRAMALELATCNIRVNAVEPGIVDTPMPRGSINASPDPEATYKAYCERIPMSRFGTPEELASAVLFLASCEASFITGAILAVDGGFLAGK